MKKLLPIANTLQALAAGKLDSSDLVQSCLHAIADPSGEGARTYTRVFSDTARLRAKEFDTHRTTGALAGLPISVKALFDVAGEPTRASANRMEWRSLGTGYELHSVTGHCPRRGQGIPFAVRRD